MYIYLRKGTKLSIPTELWNRSYIRTKFQTNEPIFKSLAQRTSRTYQFEVWRSKNQVLGKIYLKMFLIFLKYHYLGSEFFFKANFRDYNLSASLLWTHHYLLPQRVIDRGHFSVRFPYLPKKPPLLVSPTSPNPA